MSADQQVPPPPGPPKEVIQPVGSATETVRNEDKIMLVLAYLGILSLIPLLTVKDSDFVRWHAKNGLVLGVGGAIVVSILTIPGITCFVTCPLCLVITVLDVMAMIKALNGQRWRIPGVSDLADKF
jgi:uncharacterized membrane protein